MPIHDTFQRAVDLRSNGLSTITGTALSWLVACGTLVAQPPASSSRELVESWEQTVTKAIARAERSVVALTRVQREPPGVRRGAPTELQVQPSPGDENFIPLDFGTGVILSADGLLLTNYHVLRGTKNSEYWATTVDRQTYRAEIVAADARTDLAVLRVQAEGLQPITLGDADTLKKGSFVIALGNPHAIARDGQASASHGIVANLQRKLPPAGKADEDFGSEVSLHRWGTLIQTDAKLNWGTSGGALVNLDGKMVGLTTSVAAIAGYDQAAGYAIPVDAFFRRALRDLREGREVEYGYLGISARELAVDERARGETGVRVTRIILGSPAEATGLHAGDVLTHLEGHLLRGTEDLLLGLGRLSPGTKASLRVRPSKDVPARTVEAVLTKYPLGNRQISTAAKETWQGIQVDYASAVWDPSRDAALPHPGVAVTFVQSASAAKDAALRVGSIIERVEGQIVDTPDAFFELARRAGNESVSLTLKSGGTVVVSSQRKE